MSAPLILGTNSIKDVGYNVDNSLRFNGGSSDDLERTPSSSGNNNKNTLSVWVKRSKVDEEDFIIYGDNGSANRCKITFLPSGKLQINTIVSASNNLVYETNRLFRDISAWYHIVIAFDSTLATAGDRCRLYVNGVEEDSFSTETDMGQNTSNFLSTASATIYIGSQSTGNYYDGYMAELVFIDGQQLDPTSFGEFDEDSGIWKPIDVSGLTFGTNGFYLDFEDSSALGNDVSGNNNDFTVNNLTSIDQTTDTCTNNASTWNSLVHYSTSASFSEGNLKVTPQENTSRVYTVSTMAMPTVSGSKWYAEFKLLTNDIVGMIGILDAKQISYVFHNNSDLDNENADTSVGRVTYRISNGNIKYPSGQSVSTGVTAGNNDIIMIALDSGSGKVWFGKNGTWFNSGNPATGTNGVDFTSQSWWTSGVDEFVFFAGDGSTGGYDNWEANFGNPPFSISSGNSDGNGYGNFEYSVPSGYYALNTKNLAEYG
jgi:hypothetical protein